MKRQAILDRHRRITAGILLLLSCQGCGSLATYGQDRLRDLSDVIDVRYGTGLGLGSQAQALWLATGLGFSTEWYYRQWFGRKSVEVTDGLFAHAVIAGIDGDFWRRELPHVMCDSSTGVLELLLFDLSVSSSLFSLPGTDDWFKEPGGNVPLLDCFRVGGTIFLTGVSGGLYLNFDEVLDLLGGVVGFDPMQADGIPNFRLIPVADDSPDM